MFESTTREFAANGAGASIPGRCEARFSPCSFRSGTLPFVIFTSASSHVAAGPSRSRIVLRFSRRNRGDELLQAVGLQRCQEPVRGRCGHAAGSERLRERVELGLRQRGDSLASFPCRLLEAAQLDHLRAMRLHERLDLRSPEVAGEVLQTRVPDLARQCLELGPATPATALR